MKNSIRILTALAIAASCLGCSDDDEVIDPGLTATFTGSPTEADEDLVRLTGGSASGNFVTVDVSLGGPTTSSDIYAFAFDLVLSDPSVASFTGTATVGNALSGTGCSGAPSVLAQQLGDRIVVGVSKLGTCAGNGVAGTVATVVSLPFQVHVMGSTSLTLEGPPGSPPTALDPGGTPIGTIVFDAAAATISGQ